MLAVNQENEKLMEEYEKLASEVRLGPKASPSPPLLPHPGPAVPPIPADPRPGLQSPPLLRVALASSNLLLPSLLPPALFCPSRLLPSTHSSIQSLISRQSHGPLLWANYAGPWTQNVTILLLC